MFPFPLATPSEARSNSYELPRTWANR